jgi:hypothetical protein
MPKPTVATYVYCLVQAARAPSLARAPRGLPGAGEVRLLQVDRSLWLAVCDAPLSRYGEAKINAGLKSMDWVSTCAIAHEAVVEHFSRAKALVPMKLFTLFHGDERALDYVRRERKRLDRVLKRVTGAQEWGVRIHLDDAKAAKAAAARARKAARGATSGAGFLLRKKQQRDVAQELAASAHESAGRVHRSLERKARDARRRTPVQGELGARLLLDAAYLVPRPRAAAFKAAVRALEKRLPEGYDVSFSGPWPAYNFIADAS